MSARFQATMLIHVIANAVLLYLGYLWLGTSEATVVKLAGSFGFAMVLVAIAVWLNGSTFMLFRENIALAPAFRRALRHVPVLLLLAAVTWIVYYFAARIEAYSSKPAFQIASWLTLTLRKPIKPETVQNIFHALFWLLRWSVVPVLVLPLAAGVAQSGWQGISRRCWARARGWLFWIEITTLLVAAFWLPFKLMGWIPHIRPFWGQMASFVLRLAAAYLLFVTSWLALMFIASRGIPRETQLITADSP
jgi:hypothetical protein